jgi:hypothetical protein
MQRRGREFWTKVVNDYEVSTGETHAEFAARHRVEKTTFERWLYLLRSERSEGAARDKVHLLPVQVAVGRGDRHVLVELDDGLGLRVEVGTDPSYVAALVAALRPC